MIQFEAKNVPEAYREAYWIMRHNGVTRQSRNGPVLTLPETTGFLLRNPLERVLFDPERNCNPFFHVMETVWMLAGEDHVGFPAKFNASYANYAEADGIVHGAYGKRWRDHFQPREIGPRFRMDQIQVAIAMLKKNPDDRRVVLSMWDATEDLNAQKRDLPCNTHIYFRADGGKLDMTVCNRSNDLLWGMLGANVVHFTYLQEVIAFGAELPLGVYEVVTKNLHVYSEREDVKKFLSAPPLLQDEYRVVKPYPILREGEKVEDLLRDCENLVSGSIVPPSTVWMAEVGFPICNAYLRKEQRANFIVQIQAEDWRLACRQWHERKILSSATLTAPSP